MIKRTSFKVKISNVKVTRLINAHTVSTQYLPKGKVYELQTWFTDGSRRPVSPSSATTSKVKGQGRKLRSPYDSCWTISLERKVTETSKLMLRLPTPCTIKRTSFQVKRPPGRLMLRSKVCHIFRTWRPTNFKLGADGSRRPVSPISAVSSKVEGQGRKVT